MNDKITVKIADMKMARGSGILITYALGSCIGLCFEDPALHLGALLHVMLPMNMEAGRKNVFKYADTGIRETLRQMTAQGALKSRITVKIAGGAKMFEVKNGNLGNIGQRNIDSVHTILRESGHRQIDRDAGQPRQRVDKGGDEDISHLDQRGLVELGVFDYAIHYGMQHIDSSRLVATDLNGQLYLGTGEVKRGLLEMSNTDLTQEFIKVIESQRAFSYCLKMVTTSDEIESTFNNLRG